MFDGDNQFCRYFGLSLDFQLGTHDVVNDQTDWPTWEITISLTLIFY